MNKMSVAVVLLAAASFASATAAGQWAAPKAPVIPQADGYVSISKAAVPPDKSRTYRAIFDATHGTDKPTDLVPALNMAGSELNLFGAAGVSLKNVKFAVVFHGSAMDGLLDDSHYRAKFGVENPNLKVMEEMKKRGVELFVCGQNLAFEKIDPKTLSPDVQVASDALLVLMAYQNDGYALLTF